ncbi:PLC-like phosphodiesterase [Dendrothele bispora CBS 962.96]|uniref:PLC-like phosphodiesterase n=1 Tax=Dendrothele bispora (strain CBS 962.96) TaxID=1314807 RepID=A0A4S8MSU0_DENBC|nr:PLC-like phosphodiesterase [Dendrothele bispora CBS 962.96]
MLALTYSCVFVGSIVASTFATPSQLPLKGSSRYFDVQGHRGGRGNTVENLLPAFAWALIDGTTTLELDNGITKDGEVVVWHDEEIVAEKCLDTAPAFQNDPDFPYVGKTIANLTLAQLKTLDCGSTRQINFPLQLVYPRTKISTLQEVFDFVECADPEFRIQWNIESKINPVDPNKTRSVEDFVTKQHEIFVNSPYKHAITFQSFDWRSLVAMKALDSAIITSALIDADTATMPDNSTSPWLAGLRLDEFEGSSLGEQIANAANFINADILSPADIAAEDSPDPAMDGYVAFTTKAMVDKAHELGRAVKPWTVNRQSVAEQLLEWKVDGIITDYPNIIRRLVQQKQLPVAPKYPKKRVLECLNQHVQVTV